MLPSGDAMVLVPILWAVVAVGWAPMLASERLRELCGRWLTDRVLVNYPLYVTLIVGVHVVLFLAVGITFPSGSPLLPAWAFVSTALVAVGGWLLVAVVLPATPGTGLPDGARGLLAVGARWYAVLGSVVFALLAHSRTVGVRIPRYDWIPVHDRPRARPRSRSRTLAAPRPSPCRVTATG